MMVHNELVRCRICWTDCDLPPLPLQCNCADSHLAYAHEGCLAEWLIRCSRGKSTQPPVGTSDTIGQTIDSARCEVCTSPIRNTQVLSVFLLHALDWGAPPKHHRLGTDSVADTTVLQQIRLVWRRVSRKYF